MSFSEFLFFLNSECGWGKGNQLVVLASEEKNMIYFYVYVL